MPAVRLAAIDAALRDAVLELEPRVDEHQWASPARKVLAEADGDPTRHPVAILAAAASDPGAREGELADAAERPVGMFAFDTGERSRNYAPEGVVGLHSFFIDHRERRRGHAQAALLAAPSLARAWFPGTTGLWLTVNERNPAAIATYLQAGWRDDGDRYLGGPYGPQHVLKAPWPPADPSRRT